MRHWLLRWTISWRCAALMICTGLCAMPANSAERITLKNGFDMICDHHQQAGDKVRLFLASSSDNFVEIGASELDSIETLTVIAVQPVAAADPKAADRPSLTPAELHEMLSHAGTAHNLDVNLLASVVRAESGGNAHAVSRAGARGLMQLMPKTATELGVDDSFRPEENISGGTAYLDTLLTRYHDNLALALAAYNAGPAAVDRWHGIPPYRETRLYVARVIRQFNASVARQARSSARSPATSMAALAPASRDSMAAGFNSLEK